MRLQDKAGTVSGHSPVSGNENQREESLIGKPG